MIALKFQALAEDQPYLKDMITDVVDRPWGCTHVFDGYVGCHVVIRDGVYFDVQDQVLDWEPDGKDLAEWNKAFSLEELLENMNRQMQEAAS